MNNLRFALRQLLKRPGFTLVAVLILAIGLGASTAIYSVVDQLFIRPLPVKQPQELVRLGVAHTESTYYAFSFPLYRDCREQCPVFTSLAGYAEIPVSLLIKGEAERIRALLITDNYFATLGINAALGRVPQSATEDLTSVVLSHRLWQRTFASDPSIIGQTIEINRQHFHVIGVAPAGFLGTVAGADPQVYLPLAAPGLLASFDRKLGDPLQSRSLSWLSILGRLNPGTTHEQGQAAVRALFTAIGTGRNGIEAAQLRLEPGYRGHDAQLQRLKLPLLLIQASIALVLFIACVNIANLLLILATTRRREMAIRLAVGATRGRLVHQLLTESLLLAGAGCVAGAAVAYWLLSMLNSFAPPLGLPPLHYGLDARVLVFSIALALLTGVAFGLLPAIRAAWSNLWPGLQQGSGAFGNPSRLRNVFAAGQVALCVLVVSTALLCLRSVRNLAAVDLGYDATKVLVVSFDLDQAGYAEHSRQAFWNQLLESTRTLPQVEAASLCSSGGVGDHSVGVSLGELDGYGGIL